MEGAFFVGWAVALLCIGTGWLYVLALRLEKRKTCTHEFIYIRECKHCGQKEVKVNDKLE